MFVCCYIPSLILGRPSIYVDSWELVAQKKIHGSIMGLKRKIDANVKYSVGNGRQRKDNDYNYH